MRIGFCISLEACFLHGIGKKARSNREKHGITFEEAATTFADHDAKILDDPEHSDDEDRFLLIGYSMHHRLLTVVHVERGQTLRIISAWQADRRERSIYEEEK